MKSQDARKLSHDKLTELRRRAVTAIQNGESPKDVARVMGVNRITVYGWLSLYRNGGWDNLDAKKRGGRKPKLDAKALRWIYQIVTLGNPNQLKMPFVLWSAKLLAAAIEKKFGIKLSKASVCRLLHQLGLSPQRPLWRAYQRDPQVVDRWLKEEYPAIRAAARKAKGEVWPERDLRGESARCAALHVRRGQSQRGCVHRVSWTSDGKRGASGLPRGRWTPDAQGGENAQVRGVHERAVEAVPPARLLSGSESRRARVEQPQEPGHWQARYHGARPAQEAGDRPSALHAEERRSHPVVLSHPVHGVCGMSCFYYETLSIP